MPAISRRDFLRIGTESLLALSGILGLGVLIRYLSYQPEPPPPDQHIAGQETDFPPGSRTVLSGIPALLIHSTNGFQAISLVCPHLGCTVQEKTGRLTCPCHGSQFDEDGLVTRRPAAQALKTLGVEVSPDGAVIVYS